MRDAAGSVGVEVAEEVREDDLPAVLLVRRVARARLQEPPHAFLELSSPDHPVCVRVSLGENAGELLSVIVQAWGREGREGRRERVFPARREIWWPAETLSQDPSAFSLFLIVVFTSVQGYRLRSEISLKI